MVRPVPGRPDLALYCAHPGSGLHRLDALTGRIDGAVPPYWAHIWPGGAALAQHFQADPGCIAGRTVLDLGAGSGLVGIAAARAGASRVICSEIDPLGMTAIRLNADLNDVAVEVAGDLTDRALPPADLIAAGDLFYDPDLAKTVLGSLRQAAEAGCEVLVGDPGRAYLPRQHLEPLAGYPVHDFGDAPGDPDKTGTVYRLS
ncbi:MAG: methyltransferase [Hyphomicrobiales bacterium]|nr:methyltransferase [Hyphomicrobiales bacterium]